MPFCYCALQCKMRAQRLQAYAHSCMFMFMSLLLHLVFFWNHCTKMFCTNCRLGVLIHEVHLAHLVVRTCCLCCRYCINISACVCIPVPVTNIWTVRVHLGHLGSMIPAVTHLVKMYEDFRPMAGLLLLLYRQSLSSPHAGSAVVRIDPLSFLAGCCTRWQNQAVSVLSLSVGLFLGMCVLLLIRASFYVTVFLCYLCVLFLGCLWLSVPAQVIDRKDSSPKWL